MPHFDYVFDELPLVVDNGVEAGLIAGEAVIEYDRAGVWEVVAVTLDGYRNNNHVSVVAPPLIHVLVLERLYGTWRDRVQDVVREQLDLDREAAEADYADMKRDERRFERD